MVLDLQIFRLLEMLGRHAPTGLLSDLSPARDYKKKKHRTYSNKDKRNKAARVTIINERLSDVLKQRLG
jgi:hypothetical protein